MVHDECNHHTVYKNPFGDLIYIMSCENFNVQTSVFHWISPSTMVSTHMLYISHNALLLSPLMPLLNSTKRSKILCFISPCSEKAPSYSWNSLPALILRIVRPWVSESQVRGDACQCQSDQPFSFSPIHSNLCPNKFVTRCTVPSIEIGVLTSFCYTGESHPY